MSSATACAQVHFWGGWVGVAKAVMLHFGCHFGTAPIPTRCAPSMPACADAVAPTLEPKGPSRVVVTATANVSLTNVVFESKGLVLEAKDTVFHPTTPSLTITCNGVTGVTPNGGDFPLGVSAVSCVAEDADGNKSPAVAIAVEVVCPPGYSGDGTGVCRSE
jgi:hypothetical protein